jgi:predicted metal-dependent hydrolase
LSLSRRLNEPTAAQLSLWDDAAAPAARGGEPGREIEQVSEQASEQAGGMRAPAQAERAAPAAVATVPCFRHPRADREIRLTRAVVGYEFTRAHRRSIGMVVGPEGLSVRAPRWVSLVDVESALRAKERWICNKLLEWHQRQQAPSARIEWRNGAELPFLGETLRVVLDPTRTGVHRALSPSPELLVGLPHDADANQIRDGVQAWLQRQARQLFEARVAHYAGLLGVNVKRVSLSSARTRWGSASADGSIRLHWRLVHFGPRVVDYVVAHELAHLREMNHSPRFWDVVRAVMPDFDEPRAALRRMVVPD